MKDKYDREDRYKEEAKKRVAKIIQFAQDCGFPVVFRSIGFSPMTGTSYPPHYIIDLKLPYELGATVFFDIKTMDIGYHVVIYDGRGTQCYHVSGNVYGQTSQLPEDIIVQACLRRTVK